jgi:hypothetical protein
MSESLEIFEAPLSPAQLAARWQARYGDPTFEDVAGKIELTEWGEILTSPVGKTHGIAAMRVAEAARSGSWRDPGRGPRRGCARGPRPVQRMNGVSGPSNVGGRTHHRWSKESSWHCRQSILVLDRTWPYAVS